MKVILNTTRVILSAVLAVNTGLPLAGSQAFGQATPAASPQVAPVETEAADRGWPRKFETESHEVIVYAPQVDAWPKYDRITFRAAVSVAAKGSSEKAFGILRVSAATQVAFEDRLVVLTDRQVEDIVFADTEQAEVRRLTGIIMAAMPPERILTVSLDRIIAAMDADTAEVKGVTVSVAPPKIFASSKPAVIVNFMGKPRFKPVPGSDLLFAINTNWEVFLDPASQAYYLLNDGSWLTTKDIQNGPWTPAASVPASMSKLPADDNWKNVLAALPPVPARTPTAVFVSFEPAELIVTTGEPELESVPGTGLMVVANTESKLFYKPDAKAYYFLTAGRWFRAPALSGPWAAASDSLPIDFKKLPEGEEFDDVLVSVPGTAAAKDAVLAASIPQKATINRSEVSVNVVYDGTPAFRPIETTEIKYASNTPYDVFLVNGRYYCCYNAVWFEAETPNGVWTVSSAVPPAIYTIPPTSPKHNVTYVVIYQSTPTTVVTGYTAGYSGAAVAATGVVMFGLGVLVGAALNDDEHCYIYNPAFYSYGCGAFYHAGYGGFVAGGRRYGPYGGAGHAAAYNPATGIYSRAGYAYGPRGAAGYRTAYNPATGVGAGRAAGVTPYGSWGAAAVTDGDKWVRGGHRTTAAGTVAGAQSSSGAGIATAQGRYGNGTTVARSESGDYYAARNGNVYKNTGDGWQQAPSNPARPTPRAQSYQTYRPTPQTSQELQSQAASRNRGEQATARTYQYRSGGDGARSAPSRGGGRGR